MKMYESITLESYVTLTFVWIKNSTLHYI